MNDDDDETLTLPTPSPVMRRIILEAMVSGDGYGKGRNHSVECMQMLAQVMAHFGQELSAYDSEGIANWFRHEYRNGHT